MTGRKETPTKRTISAMVGKGSVNHNSRVFKAENVDGERTEQNINYCNENIREVYHELFDEALERYNDRQKRADRRIDDYYEKIRTSHQEKLYQENDYLRSENDRLTSDITYLTGLLKDYKLLHKVFGREHMDSMLEQAKQVQKNKRNKAR